LDGHHLGMWMLGISPLQPPLPHAFCRPTPFKSHTAALLAPFHALDQTAGHGESPRSETRQRAVGGVQRQRVRVR